MEKKAETIIFDYGNTLVLDPFVTVLRKKSNEFRRLINAREYRAKWQRFAQLWTETNREIDLPFVSHFYQEEIILEQMLKKAGIDAKDVSDSTQEILRLYRQGFEEVLTSDPRRFEVIQTLSFLKNNGLKLAVLSNERQSALDLALKLYGIHDFFDLVVSSEIVGLEKPCARVFYYALKLLNSEPKKTAYVGDDPIRDIVPAKKTGMITILYVPPPKYSVVTSWRDYRYARINPDFIVRKFSELKELA